MEVQTFNSPSRLLAPADAAERTSLSWRTIQRKVRAGAFPLPVRISENRIGFVEAEVEAWIASLARVEAA